MPPYGSLNSPSLRKMNGNMDGNGHQRGGLTQGFSFCKYLTDDDQKTVAKSHQHTSSEIRLLSQRYRLPT